MMDYTAVRSVAVVGAGVAGLASARSLLEIGLEVTVSERAATLGGVWADGYINFGVQVQRDGARHGDVALADPGDDAGQGKQRKTGWPSSKEASVQPVTSEAGTPGKPKAASRNTTFTAC